MGCTKRYTDPSSLRKHVKSHSQEEQLQYRRSKDLANMAKRSCSPTARYSSWTPQASPLEVSKVNKNNDKISLLFSFLFLFKRVINITISELRPVSNECLGNFIIYRGIHEFFKFSKITDFFYFYDVVFNFQKIM